MNSHSPSFPVDSPVSADAAHGFRPGSSGQAPADGAIAAPPAGLKSSLRRRLMIGAALALVSGAAWYGWDYWTVGQYMVSTDDAYVKADNTTVAPKVSGYVHQVLVGDNEPVKAGQIVARIDDRDFRVALDQADADVAAADAAIVSKEAQLGVQQAVINAANATLDVDRAALAFAAQDSKRYTDLAATGSGSVQNAQQAQSRIASAQAVMARDVANLTSAEKQVDLLKAEIVQANAARARSVALRRQAQLNLSYTSIAAPVDGVVGNRSLRIGQYVQAGTQLMSVVPVDGAYIVANYKETQLRGVRKGQTVDVEVDMFPGQTVHGHVDSIAPASGQEFALLPPDNATGNFTKVVQRIAVKIVLDGDNDATIQLRPGMSVIPSIATHSLPRQISAVVPKAATKAFGASCHVKFNPFSLDLRDSNI
ncbi:HlyD family efflux transporter periplasmic adaptor subunit [Bradyrhizobium sp. CSA207]|uniref:HlyD family secretion protein n=1 Tax=Bradyrhizobium sp. CSA207 TaxID=2698826 RepID=UPI0023B1584F|nr:HlyD family secretion protein [Bradyrhizobium sp. CSA207]MDE5444314.1 HlyD family efflux transporter periplasmic adaptor subunit [Bradyrhizobium sp. CSA207]